MPAPTLEPKQQGHRRVPTECRAAFRTLSSRHLVPRPWVISAYPRRRIKHPEHIRSLRDLLHSLSRRRPDQQAIGISRQERIVATWMRNRRRRYWNPNIHPIFPTAVYVPCVSRTLYRVGASNFPIKSRIHRNTMFHRSIRSQIPPYIPPLIQPTSITLAKLNARVRYKWNWFLDPLTNNFEPEWIEEQ